MTIEQRHFLWSTVRTVSALVAATVLEWLGVNLAQLVHTFVVDPTVAAYVILVLAGIIRIATTAVRGEAGQIK